MKKTIQHTLASLAEADRVEIVPSARAFDVTETVAIRERSRIRSLLDLLEPSKQSPSGSIRAATLGFYRGNQLITDLWVYVTRDWGFIGGTGTVGNSKPLVDLIREQVARGSGTINGA